MANIGEPRRVVIIEPDAQPLGPGQPAPTFTPKEVPTETPIPMEPIKVPSKVAVPR